MAHAEQVNHEDNVVYTNPASGGSVLSTATLQDDDNSVVSSHDSASQGVPDSEVGHNEQPGPPPAPLKQRQLLTDFYDYWLGGGLELKHTLRRRQIIMISIGGTIGIGLLLNSGKILHLSGSTGLILSYSMMGIVVAAVMSCIAEMVSVMPEPGALALFASKFVDPSLGFAVAVSYWFTYGMALATLTTATTIISTYWDNDIIQLDIGWRITIFLIVLIAINIFGVTVYAEVEHFFGWLKLIMLLGLTIFPLVVSCGANSKHKYYGVQYWRHDPPGIDYRMPPDYAGHEDLAGSAGRFLAVWKSCTIAAFAYVGVEIVAVTAGEARYPKRDIPFATKYVWSITISLYVFSVIFVSLVVPWNHKNLLHVSDARDKNTGRHSPFVIALRDAGYTALPGLVNAGFMFAAWTAANTALYVSSRTLFSMFEGTKPADLPFLWTLGRTRRSNGAPTMAILVSCVFAPLAYLLCATENAQKLLDIFSRMGTISCLMVWGCQCLAFLRFFFGLKHSSYVRSSPSYPFRSVGQPFTAIFGLAACSLLVVFNGWDVFYTKPFSPASLCADYLWPVIFAGLYVSHKLWTGNRILRLDELSYFSDAGAAEELLPPDKGPVRNLFEFERPWRKVKSEDVEENF